jgi:hypothetical protein
MTLKKTVRLGMLGLTLLSSAVFAQQQSISFTAAELTGNMTRENLENYSQITYRNVLGTCFGLNIDIFGEATPDGLPFFDIALERAEYSIDTAFVLARLDETLGYFMVGRFKEVKNSTVTPIPDCASNGVFVLTREF